MVGPTPIGMLASGSALSLEFMMHATKVDPWLDPF